MGVLTKYEQETIINFNVAESDAVVYMLWSSFFVTLVAKK